MAGMRIIKRYANRKLYDTEEKRYVTLDQVAALIREGAEIKVVDNENGEDLTSVTLSQILVEHEKKREGGLPKNFLTELVKSSSTLFEYLRRTLTSWLQAANVSEEAIDKSIDDLVKKGQLTLDEGARLKREIVERTREYFAKIDETIESRVAEALKQLPIPTKADLDSIQVRLNSITERYEEALEDLRRRLAAPGGGPAGATPPPAEEGAAAATGAGAGAAKAPGDVETGPPPGKTAGGEPPATAGAEDGSNASSGPATAREGTASAPGPGGVRFAAPAPPAARP